MADYNKEEWEKFNRQILEGQFASYVECPLTRRCKWLYRYVKSMEERWQTRKNAERAQAGPRNG